MLSTVFCLAGLTLPGPWLEEADVLGSMSMLCLHLVVFLDCQLLGSMKQKASPRNSPLCPLPSQGALCLFYRKCPGFLVVLNKRSMEGCTHSISPEVDISQNCI